MVAAILSDSLVDTINSRAHAERSELCIGGGPFDEFVRAIRSCEPEQARSFFLGALLQRQFPAVEIGLADLFLCSRPLFSAAASVSAGLKSPRNGRSTGAAKCHIEFGHIELLCGPR